MPQADQYSENQGVLAEGDLGLLRHLCMLHHGIADKYERGVEDTTSNLNQLGLSFEEFGLFPLRVSAGGSRSPNCGDITRF